MSGPIMTDGDVIALLHCNYCWLTRSCCHSPLLGTLLAIGYRLTYYVYTALLGTLTLLGTLLAIGYV